MTQAPHDPDLAREIVRAGVLAADMEALKPGPASTVRNPDGSSQRETPAEYVRRIVGTAVMHLIEQGLLVIPDDAADRLEAGIPIARP
jgi:hypothetical protein